MILSILSKLGPKYSVFVSTFHATRLVISNWKIPSLSTLFDSLSKDQDKLIQMGNIKISQEKYNSLIFQGRNNSKRKEKKIVKEKKPKSNDEDEESKPVDQGSNSMKKFKKKGLSSKCYYCRKGNHYENIFSKKKMDTMDKLLEKNSIDVPDELDKHDESL